MLSIHLVILYSTIHHPTVSSHNQPDTHPHSHLSWYIITSFGIYIVACVRLYLGILSTSALVPSMALLVPTLVVPLLCYSRKKCYFPQPPFAPKDCAKASISSRDRLVWVFALVLVILLEPNPEPPLVPALVLEVTPPLLFRWLGWFWSVPCRVEYGNDDDDDDDEDDEITVGSIRSRLWVVSDLLWSYS